MAMNYLINNRLIYQASGKSRFLKGCHLSYTMATPNQIKNNKLSMEALAKLNLNMDDYEQLWQQCLLPTHETAAKIEKSAINHIKSYLIDYISIIHRFGDANDPVAQEILKPGLHSGRIGIDFDSNTFSLIPEHILYFNNDDEIMKQLNRLCIRAIDQKIGLFNDIVSSMIDNHCSMAKMSPVVKTSMLPIDDNNQLQTKQPSSVSSSNIFSDKYDQTNTLKKQFLPTKESKRHSILNCAIINISEYVFI